MGVTKSDLFTDTQNELAAYAKVLAHPARLAIIQYLWMTNTCCNSNLVGENSHCHMQIVPPQP